MMKNVGWRLPPRGGTATSSSSRGKLMAMWMLIGYALILLLAMQGVNGWSSTVERESRKLFGGYRITPKFCNATRSLLKRDSQRRGPTICMFNHECFQRQGEVVGACMDGFLFGTCCELPLTDDIATVTDSLFEQFNFTDSTESPSQSPLSSAIASQYEKFGSQLSSSGTGYGPTGSYEPVKLELPGKDGGISLSSSSASSVSSGISAVASDKTLYNKYENNYITNEDLDEDIMQSSLNSHKYQMADDSVAVYSPSTSNIKSEEIQLSSTPATPGQQSDVNYVKIENLNKHVYSSEIPSSLNLYTESLSDNTGPAASMETSTDITSTGVQQIANQIYQENQLFDHSDITHPEAETDLFNENGAIDQSYANPSDFSNTNVATEVLTTEKPAKTSYPKPQFKPKPKPTQATEPNNYILVHTISTDSKDNENQTTKPTVSANNIHSIESIILMLNDTNLGPQYETDSETKTTENTETQKIPETSSPPSYSTSSIDYDKYGSTSFYITKPQKTNPPTTSLTTKVPSTSYVYSPKPTRRPILEPVVVQATLLTNGYGTTAVTQKDPAVAVSTIRPPPNKIVVTAGPAKRPVLITSEGEHVVTSGFYTSSVGTSSEPVAISTVQPTKKVTTSPTSRPNGPTTVKLPEYVVQSSTLSHQSPSTIGNVNYANVAGISNSPSPTVHITPKPVPGLVTSSTWNNKHTSPLASQRPGFYENTPPAVYVSSLADFEDEGYFAVTKRPSAGPTVSSTAIYTIVDNGNVIGNFASSTFSPYGPTPSYTNNNRLPPSVQAGQIFIAQPIESSTLKNELYTTPDDVNNFPPVRNPNLNLTDSTVMSNITKIENDNFSGVKDDEKINMLVNKIVETFNGNFDELEAILKERKNLTSTDVDPTKTTQKDSLTSTTAKPVTKKKKKRPSGSKKPSNGTTTSTGVKKPTTAKPTVILQDVEPTSVKPSPKPSKKPTKVKRPSNSTKPSTSSSSKPVPTTVLSDQVKPSKPSSSSSTGTKPKPSSSSSTRPKPTSASKPSADDKPSAATTKKPVRTSTSKKPSGQKKPTTRPTIADADPAAITTRKPSKATKRTTKRPTTTTTSTTTTSTTTTPAPEDEIIDEEENAIDEEDEEDEDVGEETNEEGSDDQAQGPRKILCGQRPLMKSGRVVGGKAAKFGEWPWQVLVRESTWLGLFTKNKCGGVLITNEYVITAAHCQPGFLASLVAVFGEFDISSDLETKRSVTKNVKRVIVHRQYDAATFENDLAILELESPIHYDVHIVPICMPGDDADFTGRMATVTGWGRLTYGGGVPSVLQEVQVPVIENSVCQEMFHMAGHQKKILPSFVCAGYANGKRDSCEGDSGGPLVLQRQDGRYELVGTVSHGIRCAAPYLPGVYMRTTFYKPWLKSVTGVK
ncbi:serine protease filzig [Uranotaenia lowii]|uniref:serine protease filzig n=1 Tax=Uranotaenia lowii TaxID=190385 RepID=UPI00247A8D29|nr:serine protease filzig [Uranotaenia lowii]XP_055595573.1 serine protease filzig [Uranotaenia lowii]XP_055595574.1 serine protease filzig [Uranotaenia lowii]XP_055595576.1 serine protease filzig [Uranotaenia lowii]XP_055595577.1 serine protease filzig [Uranotaenia lowii]